MKVKGEVVLNLLFLSIFTGALLICLSWPAKARFYPIGLNTAGICFCVWLLYANFRRRSVGKKKYPNKKISKEDLEAEKREILVRDELIIILWLILFVTVILVFGFWVCIAIYIPLFLRFFGKENWRFISIFTAISFLTIFLMFHVLMESSLFGGVLGLTVG